MLVVDKEDIRLAGWQQGMRRFLLHDNRSDDTRWLQHIVAVHAMTPNDHRRESSLCAIGAANRMMHMHRIHRGDEISLLACRIVNHING